jgi:elongation factor P hydroxylase
MRRHDPDDLIRLFHATFAATDRTILVRGGSEPVYLPWGESGAPAQVVFAHGFFASALHEIAHWCVAGAARRALVDYGYWYKPDGRSPSEQVEFERVEVKPQALEWIFSRRAGAPFEFSADNLAATGPTPEFKAAVARAAERYERDGLPPRAARWADALAAFYGTNDGSPAPGVARDRVDVAVSAG